ncbi:MAG: DUF4097 family beta strand repeat protein [Acidobacteria bacterium]|nr:DUF4097 family beta strand repeat protein [Acidobacteriota bacterium]
MSLPRRLAAFVLVLAPLAAGDPVVIHPAQAETVTETRTLALASGSTLKVKNVNGFIRVEGWDREEVVFKGEFKPSSKDEQVKVILDSGPKGLEIRGEYPKSNGWFGYRGPECKMELKVPRKVFATLETVNGEITLAGVSGDAACKTVNGGIRASELGEGLKASTVNGAINLEQVKGALHLNTVNGSIQGRGLEGGGRGIEASTVNGSVKLQTEGLKGRLRASTVNGSMSFKAKGAEQVEVSKRHMEATFPGGDQKIALSTVNGSITVE